MALQGQEKKKKCPYKTKRTEVAADGKEISI
jgi:hypothetical protein